MHKPSITLPVHKPRNGVVRALIAKLSSGSGRHKSKHEKRKQSVDDSDLAQRVRDVGEW
jgi:hypothetical protein